MLAKAKLTAFGKGLLEDVAAKLSQLSANHDLEVVPARTLEDKKVSTLADAKKEFGVSLGLTVSLEQANDLVRAAYGLTDAKSGRNLAGAAITAPVSDVFTIEDQVANGVAGALQLPLRSEEKQALGAHSTSQPEGFPAGSNLTLSSVRNRFEPCLIRGVVTQPPFTY